MKPSLELKFIGIFQPGIAKNTYNSILNFLGLICDRLISLSWHKPSRINKSKNWKVQKIQTRGGELTLAKRHQVDRKYPVVWYGVHYLRMKC